MLNLMLILIRSWRAKNAPKLSSKYLGHGIGAKLVSNCEQNMLHNESYQIFYRKLMSMLTGLKVYFTVQKIIQRIGRWMREGGGEGVLNFEGLEMQK